MTKFNEVQVLINHGKFWSTSEEKQIISYFSGTISSAGIENLIFQLNRSPSSVLSRECIKDLGYSILICSDSNKPYLVNSKGDTIFSISKLESIQEKFKLIVSNKERLSEVIDLFKSKYHTLDELQSILKIKKSIIIDKLFKSGLIAKNKNGYYRVSKADLI